VSDVEPWPQRATSAESESELFALAFEEWQRVYRDDPEQFMSDAETLAESCETYGQHAAATFQLYLDRMTGS